MDSDAGKRERGNSVSTGHPNQPTTTNAHTTQPSNTNASRQQVEETREHSAAEETSIEAREPVSYGVNSQIHKPAKGNPAPRHQSNFSSPSTTSSPKPSHSLLEPPVTKGTLSELDVNKIVHNPKLRHDINFDPELHYRPNIDGEKGRKKSQKATDFWDLLSAQLQQYLTNREQFEREVGDGDWSLPATLKAIRGILEALVPQRDRASVEETFNVDMLMQQFRMGVADLDKLASWLSRLLKCHCAPMRDNWVDEMVSLLSTGDRTGNVPMLVSGMRHLLGVLEAMKLDVANHQIRCLRPLLIEDTVQFEQKFFMKKIASGRVDTAGAHAWFKRARSLPDIVTLDVSTNIKGETWDFIKALVNLTLQSKSNKAEPVPHTFLFDEERLMKLRADILDLVNMDICMRLYRTLEAQSRQDMRFSTPDSPSVNSFATSPFHRPASPADAFSTYSSPTIPLNQDFATNNSRHAPGQERGQFVVRPSGQQVWIPSLSDGSASSTASSPRSSPATSSFTPDGLAPTPLYLSKPYVDSSVQVWSSLLAILASSTSSDKWSVLSSSLALQIVRSTTTSLACLPNFEKHLASQLSNPSSLIYQESELRIVSQLFPVLQGLVASYTNLTNLQIFEAATSSKHSPMTVQGPKEEITEIATRIAHIGILHLRVWGPLAYLIGENDGDEDQDVVMESSRP